MRLKRPNSCLSVGALTYHRALVMSAENAPPFLSNCILGHVNEHRGTYHRCHSIRLPPVSVVESAPALPPNSPHRLEIQSSLPTCFRDSRIAGSALGSLPEKKVGPG